MTYTPQLLLQHNSQVICHGNTQNESKKPSAEKAAAPTLKMLIHGDNCQMQTEVTCVYFHISFHWSQHHTGQTAKTYRESKKQGSLQNHFCCIPTGKMMKWSLSKKTHSSHCTSRSINTEFMLLCNAIAIGEKYRNGIKKGTTGLYFYLNLTLISKKLL